MGCLDLIDYSTRLSNRLFRRRSLRHIAEPQSKPQQLKYWKNLQKILNIILKYGERGGISHKVLADNLGLDRKTIRKYTSKLMEAHLIRREGNKGKYFPNSRGGIFISAEILCEKFRDWAFPSIKEEHEFFSTPIKKRKLTDLPGLPEPLKEVISDHIVPRKSTDSTDDIDLERILFDFSNTIGGFITYVLIKSVNLSPQITEHSEEFEEKGLLAQKWIADTLSVLSEDLIYIFEEYTSLHYSAVSNN